MCRVVFVIESLMVVPDMFFTKKMATQTDGISEFHITGEYCLYVPMDRFLGGTERARLTADYLPVPNALPVSRLLFTCNQVCENFSLSVLEILKLTGSEFIP